MFFNFIPSDRQVPTSYATPEPVYEVLNTSGSYEGVVGFGEFDGDQIDQDDDSAQGTGCVVSMDEDGAMVEMDGVSYWMDASLLSEEDFEDLDVGVEIEIEVDTLTQEVISYNGMC